MAHLLLPVGSRAISSGRRGHPVDGGRPGCGLPAAPPLL